MLKRFSQLSILLFASLLIITSCGDGDNECDNTCPEGSLQLLDCTCMSTAGPCDGVICAPGEILTADCDCVEEGDPTIERVEANIASDVTWTNDKTWILGGRVAVESGVTLTIEAGTVVKGEAGAGASSSALLIARGGKLNAKGTAEAPIILTSIADELTPEMVAAGNFASPNLEPNVPGLWGGLIILGNAPISAQNENDQDVAELQIEGIPTSDSNGLYGGNNPEDNSGCITYISIRHGGTNIGAGNEINGLTLGGVGSGTEINNVEVVANADDGIEWFGGTVSLENVLVWNCGDDGLDTDQAWNGTCSNWIVALPQGGSAMELDGPEGTYTQGCNSFDNGIIYGGAAIDHFVDWDDNTNSGITNLYIFGIDAGYDANAGIESFGGDGLCASGTWEFTAPAGFDAATMFVDFPAGAGTEVGMNANTVGPNASEFGWTWGATSGTLNSIGL